jgi:hypothetical protein
LAKALPIPKQEIPEMIDEIPQDVKTIPVSAGVRSRPKMNQNKNDRIVTDP